MSDDKNRDPTFIYTVPETVFKVPSPGAHAAQLLGLQPGLGNGLKGDTFLDLVEDAFYTRKSFEAYANRLAAEEWNNRPAPMGATERESYDGTASYRSFKKAFENADRALGSAGRSAAYSNSAADDAGLWVPLQNE